MSRPRKFANPWPNAELDHRGSAFFRWQWQRIRHGVPPKPPRSAFPLATPRVAYPRADFQETRITWLGHASFLLQIAGLNLLFDPVLSKRASPFANLGPSRFVDVPLRVDQLPPIDAVLLSHDHYDHLDERTVVALTRQYGENLKWITPLAYRDWFARRGVHAIVELDWWQTAQLGPLAITACPAQHWTRRGWHAFERLWCSFMVRAPRTSVYFAGDSGYCPVFKEIGERFAGCDIALLPIGAYEPRWFMRASHMNPEEAVQTFLDVRGQVFVPMHWGTFRLTDEDMLEPPQRLRAAWRAAELEEDRLKLLKHGETFVETWG